MLKLYDPPRGLDPGTGSLNAVTATKVSGVHLKLVTEDPRHAQVAPLLTCFAVCDRTMPRLSDQAFKLCSHLLRLLLGLSPVGDGGRRCWACLRLAIAT